LSWLYFLTGNASVPRAELDRVGCFDEDFTGYGHEDLELGYRLQRAGIPIEYEPNAIDYHWHPVAWDEQQRKYELAGRSTVRFFRKHPAWDVQLRLGMTPLSLALHGVVERTPALKDWIERGAAQPGFARTLSYQYHYLTGVKAALRG
jgi:GT2 family glycosyltransferase